jgi:hypothetical protein
MVANICLQTRVDDSLIRDPHNDSKKKPFRSTQLTADRFFTDSPPLGGEIQS